MGNLLYSMTVPTPDSAKYYCSTCMRVETGSHPLYHVLSSSGQHGVHCSVCHYTCEPIRGRRLSAVDNV